MRLLRSTIFHTPRNAFHHANALASYADGALVIDGGKVIACGDYTDVGPAWPGAPVEDLRGGYIVPGFIDTHIHYPQTRIIGGLGLDLLDWLEQITLPEEARFSDADYAATIATEFIAELASHGTTTALVFGSHFVPAVVCLLNEAAQQGLRIFSGLVMADRNLRPELHQTPDGAYRDAKALIARFPNYAVTPRFALSCSAAMLEVCGTLLREHPGLIFTTHINENVREIEEVRRLSPDARDYLSVYEDFELIGRDAVLAHNIHPTNDELVRLAAQDASIAHCPCSNAALGSGIFPLQRHLDAGVHLSAGTDVGGGTGFGMMKEVLQAYLLQRVALQPFTLTPAQMLYLATRAGAEALNIENETGDFTPGKSADYVYLRPKAAYHGLSALLTHADSSAIQEVRVRDRAVYTRSN